MPTIAFIGGDGAGKSTIINQLISDFPIPMKCLYMGMSARSAKHALPTTRLCHFIKQFIYKRKKRNFSLSKQQIMKLYYEENRGQDKRGKMGATARLLNRLAEEWYRQLISWIHRLRGFIVLYDRYFIFDFAPAKNGNANQNRLSERLHRWHLNQLYPKPDLIIFLDAPPEILMQRKGEANEQYLHTKRKAYLQQGMKMTHFYVIDATLSFDQVYAEVTNKIYSFLNGKLPKSVSRISVHK